MTLEDARELYLGADCSYFLMCSKNFRNYIAYRRLEVTKIQENQWRREKIDILCKEIKATGDGRLFIRLYDVASGFRDYGTLIMLANAIRFVQKPEAAAEKAGLAETVLGQRDKGARGGMIYWAYDIGQRALAILLLNWVADCLEIPRGKEAGLGKRLQKDRTLRAGIASELGLN